MEANKNIQGNPFIHRGGSSSNDDHHRVTNEITIVNEMEVQVDERKDVTSISVMNPVLKNESSNKATSEALEVASEESEGSVNEINHDDDKEDVQMTTMEELQSATSAATIVNGIEHNDASTEDNNQFPVPPPPPAQQRQTLLQHQQEIWAHPSSPTRIPPSTSTTYTSSRLLKGLFHEYENPGTRTTIPTTTPVQQHHRPLSAYTNFGSPLVSSSLNNTQVPATLAPTSPITTSTSPAPIISTATNTNHHHRLRSSTSRNTRNRSYSLGCGTTITGIGWNNHQQHQSPPFMPISSHHPTSPWNHSPRSTIATTMNTNPHPSQTLPPYISSDNDGMLSEEQRNSIEMASSKERQRIKECEFNEMNINNIDELKHILKKERYRTMNLILELNTLKCISTSNQLQAEVLEENRINTLMKHINTFQHDKEHIIIELEREEEMVRFIENTFSYIDFKKILLTADILLTHFFLSLFIAT